MKARKLLTLGQTLAVLKLKHVEQWRDRYDKRRYYFRIGKGPRVALVGDPGSEQFNASYAKARGTYASASRGTARDFNALSKLYFASPKFKKLAPSTAKTYALIIDGFAAKHGHRLVSQMTMAHVDIILGDKSATPSAANALLKKLRILCKYAIRLGWISIDPTVSADKFKEGTFHTWSESEIAKFESRWPLGSRERTAFDLHLYTGQRRGDVAHMLWDDIEPGGVRVVQQKTGAKLLIPLHPNLKFSLERWGWHARSIIANSKNRPYTVESYGNLMSDAIGAAGLPSRCVLHGVRKAAARRLAEAGATTRQIMAVLGWSTLAEAERYTAGASQELLAGQAMERLK